MRFEPADNLDIRRHAISRLPPAVTGAARAAHPVIIEFPSLDAARRWYRSDEYAELKALRQSASKANAIFIERLQQNG